jgi:hypothetical protein
LEPASPLKSINTPSQPTPPPTTNGFTSRNSQDNNLAVLKSIQLTPPTAANRHHHSRVTHQSNGFDTNNNSNFLNGTSSHNGSIKSDNSDFVADFSKASIYNSNNSLNSAGSGGGKTTSTTTRFTMQQVRICGKFSPSRTKLVLSPQTFSPRLEFDMAMY